LSTSKTLLFNARRDDEEISEEMLKKDESNERMGAVLWL
jgi:hypothetical protein